MDTVKIIHQGNNSILPRILDVRDVSLIFLVKEKGLYFRCKSIDGSWSSIRPRGTAIAFPDDILEAYLMASPLPPEENTSRSTKDSNSTNPSPQDFFLKRRGDLGTRAVPSMQSLKKKKPSILPCYKNINLSSIADDEIQDGADIPVDLNKLHSSNDKFTIDDIQKEISSQLGRDNTFIITNKKGFPIHDIPNTRGKLSKLLIGIKV